MFDEREPLVEVNVYGHTNEHLKDARVTLESLDPVDQKAYELTFDETRDSFVGSTITPGQYVLHVAAHGYAAEQREVQVDPAGLQAVMIIGGPGLPFLYRGDVKVPFEPHLDLIAVALQAPSADETEKRVLAIARKRMLRSVKVGDEVRRQHILVLRSTRGEAGAGDVERVHDELGAVEGVAAVGAVVRMADDSVSFLTEEIVVKFKSHIVPDDIPEIAKRFKLQPLRRLPQLGNAFLFRSSGGATYASLEVAARLVESGVVEYAEPNLVSTVIKDALKPTDFLFPMQWHLPLIHCPDAWQALKDNVSPSDAFGSPNIIIAVVDSGVDVGNPDFTANVSNGSAKVYQVFDFHNMVANNDVRQDAHGTCCAGIATALANNASGVPGQNEGAVGAAGNCRLIAAEYPAISAGDVGFSDMYLWLAGFDPASSIARFPAPINPGADVITSSFGFAGLPISGLMKDTFDLLTDSGRGGRGVLLFFSVGNGKARAAVDFTLERPWAAYTRTFAVAASTLATDGVKEIHPPYSNYGGGGILDFCAPSSSDIGDPYNPPKSYTTVTPTDRTEKASNAPDAPSHWTAQTTISAAVPPGATKLTVGSTAGFIVDQFLVIGTPGASGAEFSTVSAIPDDTHLTVDVLKNPHGSGTAIYGGPGNSVSTFGLTSSATPLAAGVAALVLTARPSLTWIQVRDILRRTAVHIDGSSTDVVGIWRDVKGVASNEPGYLGAHYSRWYGFGRIDALAAVKGALATSTPVWRFQNLMPRWLWEFLVRGKITTKPPRPPHPAPPTRLQALVRALSSLGLLVGLLWGATRLVKKVRATVFGR
jgi:hypothetical protein